MITRKAVKRMQTDFFPCAILKVCLRSRHTETFFYTYIYIYIFVVCDFGRQMKVYILN